MMDVAPKIKDPEIIAAEKICLEMQEIAKKLPKSNDVKEEKEHEQFGNNFYLILRL